MHHGHHVFSWCLISRPRRSLQTSSVEFCGMDLMWKRWTHTLPVCKDVGILNRPLNILSTIFKKNQIWLIPPWLGFEHENGELRESERTDEKWVGSYPLSLCPPLPLFQTKGRLFLVTFIFNHLSVWSLMSLFMLGWGVSGLWARQLLEAPQPDQNRRPPRYVLCRGAQYVVGQSYYLPINCNITLLFSVLHHFFVVICISEK